jgi:hypothetical protein
VGEGGTGQRSAGGGRAAAVRGVAGGDEQLRQDAPRAWTVMPSFTLV